MTNVISFPLSPWTSPPSSPPLPIALPPPPFPSPPSPPRRFRRMTSISIRNRYPGGRWRLLGVAAVLTVSWLIDCGVVAAAQTKSDRRDRDRRLSLVDAVNESSKSKGRSFLDALLLPESSKPRRSSGLADNDLSAADGGGDGHVTRGHHHHRRRLVSGRLPHDYSPTKRQPTKRNSVSWLIAATLRTCKDSFGECLRQRRLQYSVRTHQMDAAAIKSKVVAP